MADSEAGVGSAAPAVRPSMSDCFTALFENVQEGAALHELVLDAAGEPIDYRIVDVNPQFEKQTGLRRCELAGKLASQLFGASPPPMLAELVAVARDRTPRRAEVVLPPLGRQLCVS